MPIRPRQHVLQDLAHAALLRAVERVGWTVEPLSKDYGEDFLVRIFQNSEATPFTMFVQSKATDSISRYLSKDLSTIHYPIETRHLTHWERFWEPVILAVYDAKSKKTYWRVVQPWLEQLTVTRRNRLSSVKTSNVSIPVGNQMNSSGLKRLHLYTQHRFDRFKREQDGANYLIECIKETIGLEVEYNAQSGIIMIPKGSFQPSDEGSACYFFGKIGAMLTELAQREGKSEAEILDDAILNAEESFKSKSKLEIAQERSEWITRNDA